MIARRHFLQAALATTALYGASGFGNWAKLAAQQTLTQEDLIGTGGAGNVTLVHITDIHAQTQPIYFREPEFNLGVGSALGQVPHLTGADFRAAYGISQGSHLDYALTYGDFAALAQSYGRMGGLDRIATVVNAIRSERPDAIVKLFERGGTMVAVIGQAFPYMPIANPGWMFPEYSFGLRRERIAEVVEEVRGLGAEVVVLLSHNGFDTDRQFARDIPGIDVILTGHTHDALPDAVQVGNTFLIASGSHGKFVSRVELDVRDGALKGLTHRLIPIFSDVIAPDPDMAALIAQTRAPFEAEMGEVIGTAGSLLYRRGNFNGTWDDVICNALISQRDAQIALSPGFRWGPSVLPGQEIKREDIYNATAMSYPQAYRTEMSGEFLKVIMEDVADNIFNPDPYYQQGGDMVRVGGMGYRIDVNAPAGSRISEMTLLETGERIDPAASYVVAGWASVNEGTEGPAIWDVLEDHILAQGTVTINPNTSVDVIAS
ncbi:MAG: thiosulfohydrolase SoxB [Rhodobacteraceae bacterium]|nr:thiosulfohydrolase SoxB [Paracoccaceae bacterium]